MLVVLERVQQSDQPGRLDRTQDVPLDKDVLDLVHLRERALAHLFERAHLVRIGFTGEVDRAVPALTDLRDDAELVDAELGTALAEKDALAAVVRLELAGVVGTGYLRRGSETALSSVCKHTLRSETSPLKASRRLLRLEM